MKTSAVRLAAAPPKRSASQHGATQLTLQKLRELLASQSHEAKPA